MLREAAENPARTISPRPRAHPSRRQ